MQLLFYEKSCRSPRWTCFEMRRRLTGAFCIMRCISHTQSALLMISLALQGKELICCENSSPHTWDAAARLHAEREKDIYLCVGIISRRRRRSMAHLKPWKSTFLCRRRACTQPPLVIQTPHHHLATASHTSHLHIVILRKHSRTNHAPMVFSFIESEWIKFNKRQSKQIYK